MVSTSYELSGTFVEACDCSVMCPCWVGEPPDESECAGLFAWHIERGSIGGVDVSSLAVASLSFHEGHRADGGLHVVQVIDHRADGRQRELLTDAFAGRLGGPLGELAKLTEEIVQVAFGDVDITSDGASTTVTVGRRASVTMRPLIGATKRITTLADSALAVAVGSPAEVGRADRFRMSLRRSKAGGGGSDDRGGTDTGGNDAGGHDGGAHPPDSPRPKPLADATGFEIEVDVRGRSAMRGRFAYVHSGGR